MATVEEPASGRTTELRSYWCSRIFIAAWVGYAGFYFCRKNIPWTPLPISSQQRWLSGLADLLMVFGAGYTVGQFVGGWAADKFGARRTVLFGGLLSLISTALLVTNAPVAIMMGLQALNGFGQGFGWPAMMALLRVWLPRGQFAVAVAWWSTSYTLGSFLATALATALSTVSLIPLATGSKLSILVPCGVLLATTLYFFRRARDLPSEADLEPIGPAFPQHAAAVAWKPILANGEIQLLGAMYFFLKLTRYALLFWLPLYILETQHSRGNSAVALSSLFELTGFLGAIFATYASDRWFGARRYPVGAAMLFAAAFVFLLHPVVSTWGPMWTGISIALTGILICGPDVLMASVAVVEAVPPEQAGRAAGYVNGVGSLGQMASPVLVAFSTHIFGWNSIFSIFVVCSLTAAALLMTRWNAPGLGNLRPKIA
jgi:sugar phosphate permease